MFRCFSAMLIVVFLTISTSRNILRVVCEGITKSFASWIPCARSTPWTRCWFLFVIVKVKPQTDRSCDRVSLLDSLHRVWNRISHFVLRLINQEITHWDLYKVSFLLQRESLSQHTKQQQTKYLAQFLHCHYLHSLKIMLKIFEK